MPRNDFVGDPIHRVDLRLTKRLALGSRARVDGILEVFNAFERANYGITMESNSHYGQPTQTPGLAYSPQMLRLGFRATF